jgi:tyrosinase
MRYSLWTALTSQKTYNGFATQSLLSVEDNPNSLEGVHGNLHVLIGGDFGNVPTSSFDPVFMVHHCMVERIFGLWQAANPTVWVEPWVQVGNTFTFATGSVQDASSPLTPFHSTSDGQFWTCNSCRDTATLGYQYADLASGKSAASIINQYSDTGTGFSKRSDVVDTGQPFIGRDSASLIRQEYVANVKADARGTEGSFIVFIFAGPFDESNPAGWSSEDNLIGMQGFFTGSTATGDGSGLVNAGVPLTPSLQKDAHQGPSALSNMTKDAVAAYLKEHIEWRVRSVHGAAVPPTDIPGLEIAVMTATVMLPGSDDELPVWSEWTTLTEITQNKTCGYSG